ncbi:MAG: amino acid adenylation domain-containing protein [Lachnospiraceae bacterium]|nr:amino acid adenylation domain-containing protein [Lachnospiraceae bacterium]
MFDRSGQIYEDKILHFWSDFHDEETVTYGELNHQAKKLAQALIHRGVHKDDKVMLQLAAPGMYVRSFWGLQYCGAVPMALPFAMADHTGKEVMDKQLNICRNMDQLYILVPEKYREEYLSVTTPFPYVTILVYEDLEREEALMQDLGTQLPALDRNDTCCILFSSGSTDSPKGVVLAQKTMTASICGALKIIDYTERENSLSWLPLTHAFGFIGFHLLPMVCGANQHIMPPRLFIEHPRWFLEQVSRQKITVFGAMNFALKLLQASVSEEELSGLDLSAVKHLFLGAEPINADLAKRFAVYFRGAGLPMEAMRPIYGLSESAFAIACAKSGQPFRVDCLDVRKLAENHAVPVAEEDENCVKYVSVGMPIVGLKVLVVGENGKILPEGEIGELCYAGECISERYYFEETESKKKMVGKYLASGDMGYLSRGEIILTGRKKDIIFIHGQNYYPLDIEGRIGRVAPEFADRVVATQIYDRDNEPELVLFVAFTGEVTEFVQEIRHLDQIIKREQFLPFNYYLPIEAIPKTATGKIRRTQLIDAYREGAFEEVIAQIQREIQKEKVPGQKENIPGLSELWRRVICAEDAEKGTGSSNFFEAGGDSVRLLQLSARLREVYGIEISLRELLQASDEKAFFEIVEKHQKESALSEDVHVAPDPEHREETFGLTDIQLAYLIGRDEAFDMGGTSTHGYYEYKVDFDLPRFERALNRVIQNQDNLRLVISKDRTQRILPTVPWYHIEVIDGRSMSEEEQMQVRLEERARMSHAIFETERWPLFEFRCLRINERESYLFFGIDLLIMDASSIQMFQEMLLECYDNPNRELTPLTFSFRDFVQGVSKLKESDRYREDREYWRQRISDIPPAPKLPLRKDTTEVREVRFSRLNMEVTPARVEELRRMAASNGISLSAVICTAFALALSFYSNQQRCTLNVTVFNKYDFHPDLERMMGDFTSTILLPFDFQPGARVKNIFCAIQNEILQGLEHRTYSGVEFLRDLKREKGDGNRALMPVVFTSTLDRAPKDVRGLGDLLYSISQTSQVYLDCQATEKEGTVVVTWDYIDELLDERLMASMFERFGDNLMGLREEADAGAYFDLNSRDREQLDAYNRTEQPIPERTLYGMFQETAGRCPDRIAVVDAEGSYTYEELRKESDRTAAWLRKRGVQPGDRVAVMGHRRKETVAHILGVLKLGAAYVPVDPENPPARQQEILEDAGCRTVLFDVVEPDVDECVPAPADDPARVAYVIYTSGTTGKPKGVVITNKAAANTVQDVNRRYGVVKEDCLIGLSSFCFDLSAYDIFGSLAAGARLVVVHDSRDIRSVAETVEREGVTIWNSVPAFMQMYAEELERTEERSFANFHDVEVDAKDNRLRLCILSGDKIPLSLPDRVRACIPGVELVSMGGATEASIWSIFYPIGEILPSWKTIPYGRPLANQTFFVMGFHGKPCPPGVSGELLFGGAGVAQEDLHRPDLNQTAFVCREEYGKLYRTGDLGVFREDDRGFFIEFLGRKDTQIKIRGHRIELGEIESAFSRLEYVAEAAVIVREIAEGTKSLVAFVKLRHDIGEEEIRKGLAVYLPAYMIPVRIVRLSDLPRTANGKTDRKKLAQIKLTEYTEDLTRSTGRIEKTLRKIWKKVLGVEPGNSQNFYDLGGDSIRLFAMIDQAERAFGIRIPRNRYFTFETVAEMGELVEELTRNGDK